MAYSRWLCSDWYIFWHTSDAKRKEDEMLAVWYAGIEDLPVYKYIEIKEMLKKDDFSKIKGYTPKDHAFLREIFEEWIQDVDSWYQESDDECTSTT